MIGPRWLSPSTPVQADENDCLKDSVGDWRREWVEALTG
jgi:hypothetical protein